jgi:hypothetical protein
LTALALCPSVDRIASSMRNWLPTERLWVVKVNTTFPYTFAGLQ